MAVAPGANAHDSPAGAQAAGLPYWTYKGFTVTATSPDDLFESGSTLRAMARLGANTATFVVTWYAPSVRSAEIVATGGTASDAALVWAIRYAQSLGLTVVLKPHVDSEDGQWRAYINPRDATRWFAHYGALLDHYATLAAHEHVRMLCIGAELVSMSTNRTYLPRWRALIAGVRRRFAGKLTYSANWGGNRFAEEFPRIPFWDELDYLGISAYFPVTTTGVASQNTVRAAWIAWRNTTIRPDTRRWRKPVLFTEIGYRSASGSGQHPFVYADGAPLDTREQAACYAGLFEAWATIPWLAGALFWEWSIRDAGATDTGYDIAHKPAAAVVSAWFHGYGSTVAPPLPPTQLRTIVTSIPLALSGTQAVQGGSLTGWATLQNRGRSTVTLWRVAIAARPPGGGKRGPEYDLGAIRDLTLAPGQSYTVEITRTFGAADPPGRWHAYLTLQAIDGSWHDAGDVIPFTLARAPNRPVATGSGRIVVVGPPVLSRRVVRRGETVIARATLQNQGSAGITLARLVIAARPPGGTNTGGPFDDFGNTTAITLAPGQRYTIQQSRQFSAADPLGQWYTYVTYQDANGVWFDQPSRVILTVIP